LVAATNRDLKGMVAAGEFREDLYFRLQVVEVTVPPLRQRIGDILPLARHFLDQAARQMLPAKRGVPTFSDAAELRLQGHDWPGNVRELENCVQRALIICCGSRILPYHLGLDPRMPGDEESGTDCGDYATAKSQTLERFQRDFVMRALEKSRGNVSQAAVSCGLTRAAFQKILRQLSIR
ncbi:MAG: sigma-54-dependent Fis family transcriptional regulator, partial [Myxococcales bacterium]|nr:sigma-54-dependent Fis family transcriptional regulator [Myxococcales bacterium]